MQSSLKQHSFYLILMAILALLPVLGLGDFILHLLIVTLLFAFMGQAWNILGGFCGQFSVGHTAFFGVGAYAMTILFNHFQISPYWGIPVGIIASILLALLVGFISLQLTGIFFAMATIAMVEILRTFSLYYRNITYGTLGMTLPNQFSLKKIEYYYIILGLLLVCYIVAALVRKSRYGTFMVAIRENEDRARSLGIETSRIKVLSAVISAALTALGGSFYALYVLLIEPSVAFSFLVSIKIIIVVIIAGIGTLLGPLLGAFVAIIPDELIRSWLGGMYVGIAGILYGAVLVIVVKLQPQGILHLFGRSRHLWE